MVTQGGRGGTKRNGMERDGTGLTRYLSLSLSDTFPAFAYGYTGWTGRDGTERDG